VELVNGNNYIVSMNLAAIKSINDLPKDPEVLLPEYWHLLIEYRKINAEVQLLKKELFGKKSEKTVVSDDAQITMADLLNQIEPIDTTKDEFVEVKSSKRRKKHPGRNAIPDNIETQEHVVDVLPEEKSCSSCKNDLIVINKEKRTIIEREPAKYTKHVYIINVYACKNCKDSITRAEAPLASPLPRIIAGINLLVYILISKYQFHLPLYRIQRQIFHESRIWFTRATMVGWIAELCVPLQRIHKEMIESVKKSDLIFTDDSRIKRAAHTSYMWVYVNGLQDTVVFDYRETRGAAAPREFLKGVSPGTYLMADCYQGYNDTVKRYELMQMACMMHVRREFIEVIETGYNKDYAAKIVRYIGQLYRLERFATKREFTASVRYELRQKYSKVILNKIKDMLTTPGVTVIPGGKLGKAINYALNHWKETVRFLDRGDLPIDNGISERVIRDLAIGRKNWMFVQSDNGGKCMAILYSIIQTCKLNNIDPQEYFKDVLMKIAIRPENASVADLTPVEWLKARNNGMSPKKQPLYPSKN
jgi:transposase